MLRPYKEIIRMHRPLLDMQTKTVKRVLKTGLEMELEIDESQSDSVIAETYSVAKKLVSDATLEIAYRN